ncbi:hypothetical protein Slin15195_G052880 [Septoria linicola]|uniref:Uncharacterized protein n=1 Tax=Septoria linicola TaxID=215465 RepID=A0A9Q9APC8_9PEZI|nr:hypothetical protein Slin14017_G123670 [Septoria linicola]USW51969.1 hypothetical protein Slin15195_G052880 [Septoria linicola]
MDIASPPIDTDDLAVSLPAVAAPKSPPLAFANPTGDSLVPRPAQHAHNGHLPTSPSRSIMGRFSPLSESPLALQAIVDKQAEALRQLHKAFQAERESWDLERERMFARIHSLEQLLRNGEHHSPAKSPTLTPTNGSEILSPQARAVHAGIGLPTIAEDENISPLSTRREGAPQSIDIPGILGPPGEERQRQNSVVSFTNAEGLRVEEIPIPARSAGLSPPPPINRLLAGHTPIRQPRRPTPPPENSLSMDGIEDTPTRHNTHVNALLTQSSDEEEDMPLKGPLNMPELPHQPGEGNFTLDALSSRLQQIAEHPDEQKSRPMVYAKPSPGLASPVDDTELHDATSSAPAVPEDPVSPANTRALDSNAIQSPNSGIGSTLSPSMSNTKSPDLSGALSPQEQHEAKIHQQFEQGGIRLKKKTSTNFGAPFGSLAGFPVRKMS